MRSGYYKKATDSGPTYAKVKIEISKKEFDKETEAKAGGEYYVPDGKAIIHYIKDHPCTADLKYDADWLKEAVHKRTVSTHDLLKQGWKKVNMDIVPKIWKKYFGQFEIKLTRK